MTKLVDWYFRLLKFVIVACLALMVVLVFGNVVLRYAFNSGITVSEELSRWLFVWLTFLGATVAMKEHAHLGMDSVVSRLPAWGKKACFVASHVLMLYAVYLFFVGTWAQTVINLEVKAPATGLSSGIFYGVGLIFCVTSSGVLLFDLYQMLRGRLTEDELIQVKESEDAGEIEELQHELDRQRAQSSSTPTKQ
jgi:TRAP-type C4-dicarboxylate transport system permease small subunit